MSLHQLDEIECQDACHTGKRAASQENLLFAYAKNNGADQQPILADTFLCGPVFLIVHGWALEVHNC